MDNINILGLLSLFFAPSRVCITGSITDFSTKVAEFDERLVGFRHGNRDCRIASRSHGAIATALTSTVILQFVVNLKCERVDGCRY